MNDRQIPVHALILDDDRGSLLILRTLLEPFPIHIHEALNVAQAREVLSKVAPDIAILDIILPDGDGIDILLDIRKSHPECAVALITANLARFPFRKCRGVMPEMILDKPMDMNVAQEWVQKQLTWLNCRLAC